MVPQVRYGVSAAFPPTVPDAPGSLSIMPTRAPTSDRRPVRGGRGGARPVRGTPARTGAPSARSAPAARRGGAYPAAGRAGARRAGSPGARRAGRPTAGSPLRRLSRAGWLALVGLWSLLAGGAGRISRAVGTTARDLDPAHRRDGAGLTALAAALVVAAGVWFRAGGPLGRVVSAGVSGAVGIAAVLVPLALGWLGVRLLRHPDRFPAGSGGRLLIGWSAFTLGALGLVHIAAGNPVPPDGARAMRHAGGLLGFFAAAPLSSAVSRYLAAPILLALAGFGVLVITATPVHAIPAAARAGWHRLTGAGKPASADADQAADDSADDAAEELDPGEPLPPLRRHPARRRQGVAASDDVPPPSGAGAHPALPAPEPTADAEHSAHRLPPSTRRRPAGPSSSHSPTPTARTGCPHRTCSPRALRRRPAVVRTTPSSRR